MTISEIMDKMIAFSNGNIHDIDHLVRVWTFAKTIGELEHIDAETQYILEVAASVASDAVDILIFCQEKIPHSNLL